MKRKPGRRTIPFIERLKIAEKVLNGQVPKVIAFEHKIERTTVYNIAHEFLDVRYSWKEHIVDPSQKTLWEFLRESLLRDWDAI